MSQPPSPPPPQRVLIIKPSALGDVVTALPVLRALRRAFPRAHLAWLLADSCAPLLAHDSELDEVVLFERRRLGRAWRSPRALVELWRFLRRLRRGRYDWSIDLQGLARSGWFTRATRSPVRAGFADAREGATWFYSLRVQPTQEHTVDRNIELANALGLDARPQDMRLQVAPHAQAFAERALARSTLQPGRFIVCVPPTRWTTKLYPVRHWRRVVGQLVNRFPVVLLGTPDDRELCAAIAADQSAGVLDLCGQTRIPEMVALIAASAGVVCCDSAAKFIAPAVDVPCVTLIGPTRLERTGPYLNGRAVVATIPCQGCLRRRCRHATCMESIEPSAVVHAALETFCGK
ncbi:MAG: Lipopolysaccharide heptosyltransferase 1 [Planctomycetes bacterium ADurb.Bin126]|nr:MAG: Lipopolysaccharide heptosyltransferase 1 [Planctomycetes bacterium ADurb.Bin126]HOD81879.1 glycosyltransferase family 9 protein [Phycisphaerae bacterium]